MDVQVKEHLISYWSGRGGLMKRVTVLHGQRREARIIEQLVRVFELYCLASNKNASPLYKCPVPIKNYNRHRCLHGSHSPSLSHSVTLSETSHT